MKHSAALLWILLLASVVYASALSFAPPSRQEIKSSTGRYRFVMAPPDLTRRDSFFALAAGRFGSLSTYEADLENKSLVPYGLLYHNLNGKTETIFWKRPLVNRVFPGRVIFAETEKDVYIVTFGNWGTAEPGDHELVIYNRSGDLVRSFRAEDLGLKRETPEPPFVWYSGYAVDPKAETLSVTLREAKRTVTISLRTGTTNGS